MDQIFLESLILALVMVGNYIVYTYKSQIWKIRSDGTSPMQVTNPPRAGELGNANLPFGDSDLYFIGEWYP